MQTQQEGKLTILGQTGKIVRSQGVLALYNGLSASILRQATYSTTRFGIYEVHSQLAYPSIRLIDKTNLQQFFTNLICNFPCCVGWKDVSNASRVE